MDRGLKYVGPICRCLLPLGLDRAVASPYSLVSRPEVLPYTHVPFFLSLALFLFPPSPSVHSFRPTPPPPPRFSTRVKGDICDASPSANSSLIGHVQVLAKGTYGKRNCLSLVSSEAYACPGKSRLTDLRQSALRVRS